MKYYNNNNLKFGTYLKDNEIQEMVKAGFVRFSLCFADRASHYNPSNSPA